MAGTGVPPGHIPNPFNPPRPPNLERRKPPYPTPNDYPGKSSPFPTPSKDVPWRIKYPPKQ